MTTAVLVPVKEFSSAKTRQSGSLSPSQRRRLAVAMFMDVAKAVDGCAAALKVLASSDQEAILHARALGWRILHEERQESESASVDQASSVLSAEGIGSVLRIPADIPLVRSDDIGLILDAAVSSPGGVIVPSRDGAGTNALLRTPPDLFASRFGPDSFRHHVKAAASKGIALVVLRNPRIELDLDAPEDLNLFLSIDSETETSRALRCKEFEGVRIKR